MLSILHMGQIQVCEVGVVAQILLIPALGRIRVQDGCEPEVSRAISKILSQPSNQKNKPNKVIQF